QERLPDRDERELVLSVRRFEEMSTPALGALDRARTVVVLTVSPLEEHGPHLPVGVDAIAARHFAEALAERLTAARPGWTALLAPTLPLGSFTFDAVGTVSVRQRVVRDAVVDYGLSLASAGALFPPRARRAEFSAPQRRSGLRRPPGAGRPGVRQGGLRGPDGRDDGPRRGPPRRSRGSARRPLAVLRPSVLQDGLLAHARHRGGGHRARRGGVSDPHRSRPDPDGWRKSRSSSLTRKTASPGFGSIARMPSTRSIAD